MATITRGRTFDPSELVTAAKLHQLIDAATIAGLSTEDFTGTVRGIAGSTPASPAEAAAWSTYETSSFEGMTVSELRFMIQAKAGAVALWNPYGFESIRLYCSTDDSPQAAGCAMMSDRTNGGGVTLIAGGDNIANAIPFVVGTPRATVSSNEPIRCVLSGLAGIWRAGSSGVSVPNKWASYAYRDGAAQTWNATTASNTLGAHAVLLSHATGYMPGYLLGAPLWRR